MLRSLFFSLATLAVITVAFLFYWRMQPSTAITGPTAPPGNPTTGPSDQMQYSIGRGTGAWANSFDDRGRLASQFTATEYTPQPDRSFKVERPVNVFYLNDGQYMMVTGDTGTVYVDAVTSAKDPMSTNPLPVTMQSPNKGILHDVHIWLYPTREAEQPTLWVDVNNIAFDNDTLRIYTQGYTDESGATVSADNVPVTVRGDDYEFDGSGLTLNWNDRDRRLQLLEIAHGGRLMIKNPAKMSTPWSPAPVKAMVTSQMPSTPGSQVLRRPGFFGARGEVSGSSRVPFDRLRAGCSEPGVGDFEALPEALAAATPDAAKQVIASASKPTTEPVKLPYRAVFNDNVRVEQGDRQMAVADVMTVDFMPGGGGDSRQKNGKKYAPATAPSSPVASAADPSIDPKAPPAAEKLAAGQAQAPHTATAPAVASTKPVKSLPITVYWTGKLRIVSLESPPLMALTAGQAAVQFVGRPVELTPVGSTVHAAVVTYRNDGAVRLENSPALPIVEMRQDRGMMFDAESIQYDPATQLATILGRSDARMPTARGAQELTASWTRRGVLHFTGNPAQPDAVDRADLDGHVSVEHPSFNLKSNQLALDMEKIAVPATRPGEVAGSDVAVKRATAVGDVQCRLLRPGQADRGIDGDRLVLETAPGADGKRVPRSVVADGNVHAIDVKQEIFADHLDALIRPKPAPAVADKKAKQPANDEDALDLESMYASKNVHAKLKSGAMADADELRVTTTTNDKQKIELRGQPTASIGDGKGSTLSGPVLHVSPDPLLVTVDGPGTMRKMRRATTTQPAQPMDVSWTDSMTYDGTGNMIDVIGHVAVAMTDKSGTVDTMHGDTAHLELVDVKPAKPEKRAKPGAAPTTRPESDFGDKELKSMLLQGHVHGESELKDANGAPLRRGAVVGDRLTYDAEKGRTEIPGPGWLEMEDHRSTKAGGNRGAMAIQWKTGLLYNKPANQVVITGDTLVGFRKDAKDAAPMQLKAQRLTIDVQPEKAGAPADASIQISHVRAEENVDMFLPGKGTHFMGHSVDYDPAKEEVTLRGSAQEPGRVLDEQGASTGTFDELVIDTRTQEVDRTRGANLNMRK